MEASRAAALILIHSPDHKFQRALLPKLQELADQNKILGTDVALLVDKLLVADGKPQRFGTQFHREGDKLVMYPVEDPENLEQRRAQYLLPPMKAYRKTLGETYQVKVQ